MTNSRGGTINDASRVPAVSRATAILNFLAAVRSPQSVSAIARETGYPKTSSHGICNTLVELRLLFRGVDGTYWLGARVAEFGARARLGFQHTLQIGLLIPTRDNAYYTAPLPQTTDDARAAGGEILIRDARSDPNTQRTQWFEMLNLGVDALLVDAVDSNVFDDLLSLTSAAGIPVIAIGSRINGVSASVTSDNVQAGIVAGHYLAGQLAPGARIAIVDGLHKNANADRVTGFREAIREYPELEIVDHINAADDDTPNGNAATRALMARTPGISGIFAVCDPIAFGVGEQLSETNQHIPIVSVDGREEAVDQITGSGPIIATAAQDPLRIFHLAIGIAVELATGHRPLQAAALVPVKLITRTNAARYIPWG